MENIFEKENALRIIDSIKDKKIDIRKTIEKSQSANSFGLMHTYCMPLDHDDRTRKSFPELMGMEWQDYKDYVDEAYYDRVVDHLEEGNGIYITLAYVCEASPSKDDEIYEFKMEGYDYEVEEDDHISYFGVFSCNRTVYLKHHSVDELFCDDTSNYGINVRKVNGEYVYRWGIHGGAACCTPPTFDEFTDMGDFDDFCDLNNPVNQLVVAIMENCIVFE